MSLWPKASLEEKQQWMRERQNSPAGYAVAQYHDSTFGERHFTVAELAQTWNLGPDAVRRLFENEPGVLVLGANGGGRYKRRYTTLRIPQSVAERVYRRLLSR